MGTTSKFAIPYVDATDFPNAYPIANKALADRLEAILGAQLIMVAGARSTTFNLTASTDLAFPWESFSITDPSITYSAGSFTFTQAGTYMIQTSCQWERNTVSSNIREEMHLVVNGTLVQNAYKLSNPTTYNTMALSRALRLVANDKVRLDVRSGGTGGSILAALGTSIVITRIGS